MSATIGMMVGGRQGRGKEEEARRRAAAVAAAVIVAAAAVVTRTVPIIAVPIVAAVIAAAAAVAAAAVVSGIPSALRATICASVIAPSTRRASTGEVRAMFVTVVVAATLHDGGQETERPSRRHDLGGDASRHRDGKSIPPEGSAARVGQKNSRWSYRNHIVQVCS